MNSLENKMVELLLDMKKNYSVIDLKAEFEAEGSRINELMRLKEIASNAGLSIAMKIGGGEAITDIFEAQKLGISAIVAPMIESSYALKKYLIALEKYVPGDTRKNIKFVAMIETIQGYRNVDEILAEDKNKFLNLISVGRVDLSGSLGLQRNEINNEKVYQIVEEIFTKAKKRGLETVMGGGIAKEAIPFIKKLVTKKLLDRYETRKIIFHTDPQSSATKMEEGIIKANLFELFWLQNKKKYYTNIAMEEDSRMEMLMSRIYKID
ncbi:MAG: aldolase/citrate lyase family protein [Patescibacteria group bacterium]